MSRSKSCPAFALSIKTYAELAKHVRAFAEGHLNFLLILGDAGLGKSRCVREAVRDQACWITGNATPFGIYLKAYEHRDRPLVLDDVDALFRDRQGIRILKALCQSDPVKTLDWQSDAQTLVRRRIPRQFSTTSRVALIANDWQSLNADVAALEDRAHFIVFEPSPLEVHSQAGEWFWDQEVFDFVAAHLHLVVAHSLRTYVLACEKKQANLNWKEFVLSRCVSGTALKVAQFKCDETYRNEEERVKAFVESGAGCRATYFNYAKKLNSSLEEVPPIKLTSPRPFPTSLTINEPVGYFASPARAVGKRFDF